MGWVSCSEHIPQRTVVCRHKPTRSHGVPRRSPRIDRACDDKDQQLPGVSRPLSSEAAHSPPLHSQNTAQNSGLPSARPRQDPSALPLQWSARSACPFLASAQRSVITKRRHLALAAVGARTSLIPRPTAPPPLIARTTVLHEPRSAAHFTIRPRTRPSAGAHDRPPSLAAAPSPALHSRPRCSARRQRTSLTFSRRCASSSCPP
jgi:hypothetical protein